MRIQQRLTRLEARRHALHLLRLRAMDDNMWRGLGADDELLRAVEATTANDLNRLFGGPTNDTSSKGSASGASVR